MITTAKFNELNKNFWASWSTRMAVLLAKEHLVRIVVMREKRKAKYVYAATSELDRIERIRHQISFEQELEYVAEELAALPIHAAQIQRAKKPRARITEDGKTLGQVVDELARAPEHRDETTKELWLHLFAKLDEFALEPKEIAASTALKQLICEYNFKDRRKTITYGQFANLVSKSRRIKKSV